MACCPKCGKTRLRKNADNQRYCPKCGVLRGEKCLDRSGNVKVNEIENGNSRMKNQYTAELVEIISRLDLDGLTNGDIARGMGVAEASISRWKAGKMQATNRSLTAIKLFERSRIIARAIDTATGAT